jgi:hypothetical protein
MEIGLKIKIFRKYTKSKIESPLNTFKPTKFKTMRET